MTEFSLQTVDIIAYSKIILVAVFIAIFFITKYFNKPWIFAVLSSFSVPLFYLVLSWPLQKMWWGNNGDETFIASFLSQVLLGNPFNDFYYHGLPNFYPPLYFWVTGLASRLVSENAISAAKIGVTGTFVLWFVGIYLWQKIYRGFVNKNTTNSIASKNWFWFLTPLFLFFMLEFNDIILKPYETLPALASVLLIGMIGESFLSSKWTHREYLFFGISGGIIFLTYYFWWFLLIPTLFVLALVSRDRKKNIFRILGIGAIMFAMSSIYLIPLFVSYFGGLENWQALHFNPKDFSTFLPFADFSWVALLSMLGVIGLIVYHKEPFVKANNILLFFCFVYQFTNIFSYSLGGNSFQASRPFLFLSAASIAVGASYLFIGVWEKYTHNLPENFKRKIILGAVFFSLPFWPMAGFIDDSIVREQIEKDLNPPAAFYLAPKIKNNVPDCLERTWLSSGIPEINAYLPLHYFIAYNPHFSHPASKYSERFEIFQELAAPDSQAFAELMNQIPIDALLLYKQGGASNYPFFFWADNYPNSGKELVVEIPKEKFDSLGWTKSYEDKEWVVYVK